MLLRTRPGRVNATGAMVAVGSVELELGRELGRMRESTADMSNADLRERLRQDGYVLLRGVVPRAQVLAARRHIVGEMQRVGWAAPGAKDSVLAPAVGSEQPPSLLYLHEGAEAGAGGDPAQLNGGVARFRPSTDEAGPKSFIRNPAVERVVEGPEMHSMLGRLLSVPAVTTLDYKWLRMMMPGQTTSFHVDHCFFHEDYRPGQRMSQREGDEQGTPSMLTAWIPWCDTDINTGGLAVLRGSNSLPGFQRLRESYCDVDVSNTDISDASFFTQDPRLLASYDARAQWKTADYRAGDALIFSLHTFHGGVVNRSTEPARVRLSSDIRYFAQTQPMDPRYSLPRRAQRENVYSGGAWRTMAEATVEWGLADHHRASSSSSKL